MMNKRLEDLAIECCSQMVWDSPNPPSEFTFSREAIVKFSELIVRECADIAKTAAPYKSDDLILKWFGFDDGR
jgi:hypothetical protein